MNRQALMWLFLLVAVAWAAPLQADGCFIPPTLQAQARPSSAAQKAVLLADGDDEVLLLQTTYQGPADRFAWVVPVPSRPLETFAAEPAFLTETFRGTEPVVVTELGKPKRSRRWKTAGPPGPPAGEDGGKAPGGPPPVQVLEEKEVGDYHAVVLAATRGDELQKWLEKNGYHLPADAQPVLADYVRRHWVFVALKMQERRAREQAVLTEVAPLGLRFRRPAAGLVYPLTISRLSAPPLSAILLCVIADEPYTCSTLPTVWLTEKLKLQRDETYGAVRRQMTRNPTRLLCEFSGGAPFHYLGLGVRATDWETSATSDVHTRKASRFFGLLAPDEMTDLTFTPDADPAHADYRVLVRRRGPAIASEAMGQLSRAMVLPPGSDEQRQALQEPLTPERTPHRQSRDGWRVPAVIIIVLIAVIYWLLRPPRKPTPTALLGVLLALTLLAGVAYSGGMMPGLSILSGVQSAVDLFQEDTGCLPTTVADLAARQAPTSGFDASGNIVPLKGWRGPYLVHRPPDPLPGGHLVMDPLNAFALDTTGLQTTCEPVTYEDARRAEGKSGHGLQTYWSKTPAQVAREMEPLHQWLQAHRGHHLFAFETGTRALGDVPTAYIVDRDELTVFPIKGQPCWTTPGGLVLTWHTARDGDGSPSSLGSFGGVRSFCGVTSAADAFRLLPRVPDVTKVLALGPGAVALVQSPKGLTILKPDGGKRDYAWGDDAVWKASFAADGQTLYVVAASAHAPQATVSRLDLASGKRMTLDTGVAEMQCTAGPAGVLYIKQYTPWQVAGGPPRQLAPELPQTAHTVALTHGYAYWAMSGSGGEQGSIIYRLSLQGGKPKALARTGPGTLIMAADGTDLYTAHRSDHGVDKLTLLPDGQRPIRLGDRPEEVVPADLPRLD